MTQPETEMNAITPKEAAKMLDAALDAADAATANRLYLVGDMIAAWRQRGGEMPALVAKWLESGDLPELPEKKLGRQKQHIVVPHIALELKVPYEEKDFAKQYGAKWHPVRKVWYYENGKNIPKELERFI